MKKSLSFVILIMLSQVSYAEDEDRGASPFQPYKKNYIIYGPNEGRSEDGDFKLQLSFLTQFKAHEFENRLFWFDIKSPKILNLGFTYTQTFFDAFSEKSKPIETTDYMPGLFLSFQSRKPAFAGFKHFLVGWEHESNGEYEGTLNRSWDRGFGEIMLGFGKSYASQGDTYEETLANSNKKSRKVLPLTRMGNDQLNLRFRAAWPINISDDNPDIRDFYGVYELEASVRNQHHEFGITLLGGHEELTTVLEINSKSVPFLSDINQRIDKKYLCQEDARSGSVQILSCLARYIFAPFDLGNNHGAWMIQYFDGFGERIRDYNVAADQSVRVGYRFSM